MNLKNIYILFLLLSAQFNGISQIKVKPVPRNIPKVNVTQIKIKNHANSNTIVGTKKVHPKYAKKPAEKKKPVDKKEIELINNKDKEPIKKKK